MRKEDWAVTILWIIILAIAGAGIVYTAKLVSWIGGQPQVLAAIIAAVGVVMGGILTHYFTQRREQENERQRALRENYMEVLGRVDHLIRGERQYDAFSNVHLQTWVVGSPAVIEASKELLGAANDETGAKLRYALERLVKAMRKDVGLKGEIVTTLENVYPPPRRTGIPPPKTTAT